MLKCQQSQRTLEQIALGGDRPTGFALGLGFTSVVGFVLFMTGGVSRRLSEPFCPRPPQCQRVGRETPADVEAALASEEHNSEICRMGRQPS